MDLWCKVQALTEVLKMLASLTEYWYEITYLDMVKVSRQDVNISQALVYC